MRRPSCIFFDHFPPPAVRRRRAAHCPVPPSIENAKSKNGGGSGGQIPRSTRVIHIIHIVFHISLCKLTGQETGTFSAVSACQALSRRNIDKSLFCRKPDALCRRRRFFHRRSTHGSTGRHHRRHRHPRRTGSHRHPAAVRARGGGDRRRLLPSPRAEGSVGPSAPHAGIRQSAGL